MKLSGPLLIGKEEFLKKELFYRDLRGVDLRRPSSEGLRDPWPTNLTRWRIHRCNLQGVDLSDGHFVRTDLSRSDLLGANLEGACLEGADLWGTNLRSSNLRDANLRGANLRGACLEGADLRGANLDGAYLAGANLDGANLQGIALGRAILIDHEERRAQRGKNGAPGYAYAHLCRSDLRHADLTGADLREVNLGGADLRGANLRRADLREADLRHADLTGADLTGAEGLGDEDAGAFAGSARGVRVSRWGRLLGISDQEVAFRSTPWKGSNWAFEAQGEDVVCLRDGVLVGRVNRRHRWWEIPVNVIHESEGGFWGFFSDEWDEARCAAHGALHQ